MTAHLAKHEDASHCHNCGAAVDYHYCALCGQQTRLHVASAGEFVHEFIGHYVALEGRLWQTLRFLMTRPGFLTAEYVAGRRVRYVEPLRIYLTMSLLFFAVLKLAGPPVANLGSSTEAPQPALVQATPGKGAMSAETRAVLEFSPALGAKMQAFQAKSEAQQTQELQKAFFSYVPYAMFLLMPLFALYLKLLYLGSGRHYGEHMLFALHSNAFAFAMFGLLILISPLDIGLLTFACVIYLLAYLPRAMRRVYGGSWLSTFLRWQVLSLMHAASIGAAILAAFGAAMIG